MTGEELRDLRQGHQLTQKALAALLGYHPNYISRLERGDETISERCARLIHALLPAKKAQKSS